MANTIASVVLGGFLVLLVYLYNLLVLKPKNLRAKLQRQGIRGPSPSFLVGNIPDIKRILQHRHELIHSTPTTATEDNPAAISGDWPSIVFPYLEQWKNEYGPVFLYSTGSIQQLYIADAEMVKEICLCTSLNLGKPSYLSKDRGPLLGRGIFSSNGPIWAHQRKTIGPEFYVEKVKRMVKLMVESTTSMLTTWERRLEDEAGGIADINVDDDLRGLSADIISRACFRSGYSQGEEIFLKLKTLQRLMSTRSIGVPGSRFLPTKMNRAIWKNEKEINSMILKVVKQHTESSHEKDLLQMILEGAKSNKSDNDGRPIKIPWEEFMVDNCKSIYFAGHETTATTASWTLMLLAAHPDWQARARAEVLEICGDRPPDANMLRNMKTLTMVIHETLRLFPPTVFVVRTALEDIEFKDIMIPKGMNMQIPIPILHRDRDLWGPDAHKFDPERFSHGIGGACKTPQAYMPFGVGSRVCAGQHFAMTELKGVYLYSVGHIHLLLVTDVQMVKEISSCTSLSLGKPSFMPKDPRPLVGQGIFSSSGPLWTHQRKIIAPELFMSKAKGMVNLMVDSTASFLRNWENRTTNETGIANIKIDEDLRCLSADRISRACFGSDYSQGKEIFYTCRNSRVELRWQSKKHCVFFQ